MLKLKIYLENEGASECSPPGAPPTYRGYTICKIELHKRALPYANILVIL